MSLSLLNHSALAFLPCLRNARAFPLLPAALASVPFGFVLVRVRVPSHSHWPFRVRIWQSRAPKLFRCFSNSPYHAP